MAFPGDWCRNCLSLSLAPEYTFIHSLSHSWILCGDLGPTGCEKLRALTFLLLYVFSSETHSVGCGGGRIHLRKK